MLPALRNIGKEVFRSSKPAFIPIHCNKNSWIYASRSIRLDNHIVLEYPKKRYYEVFNINDVKPNGNATGFRFILPSSHETSSWFIRKISKNAICFFMRALVNTKRQYINDDKNKFLYIWKYDFQCYIFLRDKNGTYQPIFQRSIFEESGRAKHLADADWFGSCLDAMQETDNFHVDSRAVMLPDGSCILVCTRNEGLSCVADSFTQSKAVLHTLIMDEEGGMRLLAKNLLAIRNENRLDVLRVSKEGVEYPPKFTVHQLVRPYEKEDIDSVQCQLVDDQFLIIYTVLSTRTVEQIWNIEKCELVLIRTKEREELNKDRLIPNTFLCINMIERPDSSTAVQLTDLYSNQSYLQLERNELDKIVNISANGLITFSTHNMLNA